MKELKIVTIRFANTCQVFVLGVLICQIDLEHNLVLQEMTFKIIIIYIC